MPIVKFLNAKNRGTDSLKPSIAYIQNPEKVPEGIYGGHGVSYDTAVDDMKTLQHLFGKTEGRAYIHFILSFSEELQEQTVCIIAKEVCMYFEEFQSVWALHENTQHPHIHVIVNAVNAKTGKKFSQSRKELNDFQKFVEQLYLKHGTATSPVPERPNFEEREDYDECAFLHLDRPADKEFRPNRNMKLVPGVFYDDLEQATTSERLPEIIQGNSTEPAFSIYSCIGGKLFIGQGKYSGEKILPPGVLYEKDENEKTGGVK